MKETSIDILAIVQEEKNMVWKRGLLPISSLEAIEKTRDSKIFFPIAFDKAQEGEVLDIVDIFVPLNEITLYNS